MTPETGRMHKETIREESEAIVETVLGRQAELDCRIAELEQEAGVGIREELGYKSSHETNTGGLTNTRVSFIKNAVRPNLLKQALPISENSAKTTRKGRKEVASIIAGEDDRLLVVVGPCSIHDPEEALEYANRLIKLREHYGDTLEIIMRTYFEKPRTTKGWKGLINDPELDGTCDISLGLTMARMTLCQITDKGMPVATERVDSRTTQFLDDVSTYDVIGARDAYTARARVYMSLTSAVTAGKNPPDGDIQTAVNTVQVARVEHVYLGDGEHAELAEIGSTGNETAHLILRGGNDEPNYSSKHIEQTKKLLKKAGLPEALVVDAAHKNKDPEQMNVIEDISSQIKVGETAIKGVMIESNLVAGRQDFEAGKTDVSKLEYGKSITDACVDLDETKVMLQLLSDAVQARRLSLQNPDVPSMVI